MIPQLPSSATPNNIMGPPSMTRCHSQTSVGHVFMVFWTREIKIQTKFYCKKNSCDAIKQLLITSNTSLPQWTEERFMRLISCFRSRHVSVHVSSVAPLWTRFWPTWRTRSRTPSLTCPGRRPSCPGRSMMLCRSDYSFLSTFFMQCCVVHTYSCVYHFII